MTSRIVDSMSDQALLMRLLACWNAFQNGAAPYPFELTVGADTESKSICVPVERYMIVWLPVDSFQHLLVVVPHPVPPVMSSHCLVPFAPVPFRLNVDVLPDSTSA